MLERHRANSVESTVDQSPGEFTVVGRLNGFGTGFARRKHLACYLVDGGHRVVTGYVTASKGVITVGRVDLIQ